MLDGRQHILVSTLLQNRSNNSSHRATLRKPHNPNKWPLPSAPNTQTQSLSQKPVGSLWVDLGGGLVPVPGEWCRRIQHSDRVPSFPSSLHPQSPKPNTAIHHHRTNCSPQRQISRVHRRSRHRQGEFYVGRSGRPRQCPVCQMLCGCHRLFWRRCCRSALVLGIMESARGGEGDLGEAVEGQDSVPGCHRW